MSTPAIKLNDISCPICSNEVSSHVYTLVHGSIVKCESCAVKYVTPRATWEHLKDKIDDWSSQDVNDDIRLGIAYAPSTQKMYQRFLSMIDAEHQLEGRKMLDVGCSSGAFIQKAIENNWQVEGLELGKAAAQYTRDKFNVDVQQTTIADANYADASFDCITISEVIEHLEWPKQDIESLYRWLKPGGTLFITTPNFNSLYQRLHGAHWWVINCEDEHIIFYDVNDMNAILEGIGLKVKKVHFRGFDLTGMVNTFFRRRSKGQSAQEEQSTEFEADYYTERSLKERIKKTLTRVGLIKAAHQIVWSMSYLFSAKKSPMYQWGEQMVVIATKPDSCGK